MEKPGSWRDIPSSLLGGGRSRFLRIVAFVSLCLVLVYVFSSAAGGTGGGGGVFSGRHKLSMGPASKTAAARPSRAERRLMDAAGNATLGFGSIQFINLPLRFDRLDAATLQAWLSGIDIVEVPGVSASEINDVGMPPEHLTRVKKTEKGCWRAHANVR